MDYENLKGGNVTLEFPLFVGVSAVNVTVGDVMNIAACGQNGVLCYEYDQVYTLQS
jgi:tyrosinase